VAVGGESSGGNLAAAVTVRARDRGEAPVDHQVLLVPVLDALFETASWQELGRDYLLTRDQLEWAVRQYAPTADLRDPLISPLRAPTLAGLPPATIVVGEFDPLRDEGLAYADRLRAAGVDVHTVDVDGLIHHAILAPKALPRGRVAVIATADALAAALLPSGSTTAHS
jgi:acetyl esterase/lipase